MNLVRILIFSILFHAINLLSQEIPQDFIEYDLLKIYNNSSFENYNNNYFGPLRLSELGLNNIRDSILNKSKLFSKSSVYYRFGFDINNDAAKAFAYYRFTYRENFYFFSYPRIVTNSNSLNNYSGVSLDNKRFGFNSGETDISGIGYENDWIFVQLGRGRQSWGFGENIQIALSEDSNNYDYFIMGFNYEKFTSRYFHGYLETLPDNINRYIVGKGITYDKKNIQFGFSEITIYSGENRNIDFSYLNPLSSHLEIEYNNRHNGIEKHSGNAIWQISVNYFSNSKLRFSSNFIIDEFKLDKSDDKNRDDHRYSLSTKGIYSMNIKDNILNIYLSYMFTSKDAFRHQNGANNFVQRNKPLGNIYGSDSNSFSFGLEYYNKYNFSAEIKLSQLDRGYFSTSSNPYMNDYSSPENLSNTSELFIYSKFNWYVKPNISIYNKIQTSYVDHKNHEINFKLGVNLFFQTKG